MKQRILTLAVAALIGMAASVPASAQVRLIFASQSNPASTVGQFFGAWAKRVTDASQGTGVVEIREGGTLANFQNVYERVLDDVVQIGFGQQALIAGKFPLTEVVVLPFIVKDNTIGSVALWRLYKTGLLDKEYDQVVAAWETRTEPLIKDWAAGIPGGEKVLATYRQLYADVEAGR
jgi:TRAP-type transport system periplasmic protein